MPAVQLGDVLFRCRRRSRAAVHLRTTGSWGRWRLMLGPPLIAVALAALAAVAYIGLGSPGALPLALILFAAWGVFTASGYLVAWTPPDANLVVHEHGIRYRGRPIAFTDVASIDITHGGAPTSDDPDQPNAADSPLELESASIRLRLRDCRTVELSRAALENETADIEKLLQIAQFGRQIRVSR